MSAHSEIITEADCLATAKSFASTDRYLAHYRSEYRRGIAWIMSDLEPCVLHQQAEHLRAFADQAHPEA